jgi:hypothetical protein
MERCFFIHLRVANEVLIMDDPFCTRHFSLPLVAIIIEDWEARNQLLAWVFLFDRTTVSLRPFPCPSLKN